MRKILEIIQNVVLFLLILIFLSNGWLLFSRFVLDTPLPTLFGYSQAVVISGSMEPTLMVGDMVIYQEQSEYEVGDIVIFEQGSSFVTHRIIEETDGGFVTKGDANNTADSSVLRADKIKGSFQFAIPNVGSFVQFLTSQLGMLVMFVIAILMIELPRKFKPKS